MFGTAQSNTGGGLFGNKAPGSVGATAGSAPGATGTAGGLFGSSSNTGGLFGNNSNTGTMGTSGGLFGSKPAAPSGGGLFRSTTNNTNNMFGNNTGNTTSNTSGGLFGGNTGNTGNTTSNTGGGLFGRNTANTGTNTGGLFGGNTGNTGNTGGLFGNNSQNAAQPSSGGLFGSKPATGGLFGASNTNTSNTNTSGGLFGNSANTGNTGNSMFSGNTGATNSGGLFGTNNTNSNLFNQQQQQQQQQPQQQQLTAMTRVGDLPPAIKQELEQFDKYINTQHIIATTLQSDCSEHDILIESIPKDINYLHNKILSTKQALKFDNNQLENLKNLNSELTEDITKIMQLILQLSTPGTKLSSSFQLNEFFIKKIKKYYETLNNYELLVKELDLILAGLEKSCVEGFGNLFNIVQVIKSQYSLFMELCETMAQLHNEVNKMK